MRILILAIGIIVSVVFNGCRGGRASDSESPEITFYVGTYTHSGSEGIYLCKLDTITGKLRNSGLVAKLNSPAFINISLDDNYLWASQEGGVHSRIAFARKG